MWGKVWGNKGGGAGGWHRPGLRQLSAGSRGQDLSPAAARRTHVHNGCLGCAELSAVACGLARPAGWLGARTQ